MRKLESHFKQNFSLPARVLVPLPECLSKDTDSPLYEIYDQLAYFNQSALYSIRLNSEYYELTTQIKQLHSRFEQLSETSARLALLKQILKLEKQRKTLSIAWDRFKEHHRFAELIKNEQFWELCAQRIIVGEEQTLEELKQMYVRQSNYLNHDSHALQTAAQHSMYCQTRVNKVIANFKKLSGPYTDQQRYQLVHYLTQCKNQLRQDHAQLCWAMVQRLEFAFANARVGECDPIQSLLATLQQMSVLNAKAKLTYGSQMSATTSALAFFMQHVLQHGNADQIHTVDRALQTHQHANFRLYGTVKNPIFLPAKLERQYAEWIDNKHAWVFVRKQCRAFMLRQQSLISALLFMPKIRLDDRLPASVNSDALWENLSELQKLLARSQESLNWKQKLLRVFSRDFKRYTQQWQNYVTEQQDKVLQAQVDAIENVLSGVWTDARLRLIENPNQLQQFETRMNTCFQWTNRLDCMALKARQKNLLLLFGELKGAAKKRQSEKQAFNQIKQSLEQLVSYQTLSEQNYYQLQQQLLALNPNDRQALQCAYFGEAGDLTLLLRHYFTETLFNRCAQEKAALHTVVLQCFGVLRNLMIDTHAQYIDELFYQAIQAFKAALTTRDIIFEGASVIKSELCRCFRDTQYIQTIIGLPIAARASLVISENDLSSNVSEKPFQCLSECVEKQLKDSQQLLQKTPQLLFSSEVQSPIDCNPHKIADSLMQKLVSYPKAVRMMPVTASEISTPQLWLV